MSSREIRTEIPLGRGLLLVATRRIRICMKTRSPRFRKQYLRLLLLDGLLLHLSSDRMTTIWKRWNTSRNDGRKRSRPYKMTTI
jgi:hypothetical protein